MDDLTLTVGYFVFGAMFVGGGVAYAVAARTFGDPAASRQAVVPPVALTPEADKAGQAPGP